MVVLTVWLCQASRQNVIILTPAPVGRQGGGREACTIAAKMAGREREEGGRDSRGMPVSLQAMVMLCGPRDLIHEYS